MLGTKLRSWMEAHIVRSKNKKQRAKDAAGKQQCAPDPGRQAACGSGQPPSAAAAAPEFPHLGPSPTSYQATPRGSKNENWGGIRNVAGGSGSSGGARIRGKEEVEVEVEMTPPIINIDHDGSPAHQQLQRQHHHHPHHHHHHRLQRHHPQDNQEPNNGGNNNNNNSLSSPESAYSTGYSTDGTSPGASVPPEYYINLRTGKHYVHHQHQQQQQQQHQQQQQQQQRQQQPQPQQQVLPSILVSPRHDQTIKRRPKQQPDNNGGLQQSSTEEDIAKENPYKNKIPTPKPQVKLNRPECSNNSFHRRTESCDERVTVGLAVGGSSANAACWSPYMAASPYLSSPRQRNRIRTNPWLVASPASQSPLPQHASRTNNLAQMGGETSSTVGSSSTLSSCGVGGGGGGPAKERSQAVSSIRQEPYNSALFSPTRLPNNNTRDIKTTNIYNNTPFSPTPSIGARKLLGTVTTCSPRANRPCRHLRPGTSLSSSSSGPTSSGSEDNNHGNTSDFSDDDVTLNEMLGKYDESYVYEKETDILSDSDPTDCEDQNGDYNDNSSRITEECQTGSDLDFIDTGSLVELANSDSECSGKLLNRGHCTYDGLGTGIHSPPPTGSEAQLRRNSSSRCSTRSRCSRRCSNRIRNRSHQLHESGSLNGGMGAEGGANSSLRGSSNVLANRKRRRFTRNNSAGGSMNTGQSQDLQEASKSNRQYSSEAIIKGTESPLFEHGKQLNLNRLLVDRLINSGGTRSAGTTPISLRRNNCRDYNGKYLRNPHVSKLIDSNSNLSRRTSLEDSSKRATGPPSELKKRSNSVIGYSAINLHRAMTPPTPPRRSSLLTSENKADTEGDMKYRRLIQEAETIFEDYKVKSDIWHNSKSKPQVITASNVTTVPITNVITTICSSSNSSNVTTSSESPAIKNTDRENELVNSQLDLLQEKINNNTPLKTSDNEDGILKTISKTLEKIIIRSSSSSDARKAGKKYYKDTSEESDGPSNTGHKSHFRSSSEVLFSKKDRNENNSSAEEMKKCHQSPGYRLKQNTNIRRRALCGSNNNTADDDDDERYERHTKNPSVEKIHDMSRNIMNSNHNNNNNNTEQRGGGCRLVWQDGAVLDEKKQSNDKSKVVADAAVSLVSFRSFDLGNQIAVSSRYCPQSEPVKRKLYAGSSTFGKLQKSLMRKIPDRRYQVSDMTTADLRGENEILKVKVEQLIRERLKVEARLRETQHQIDRLKFTDSLTR